MPEILGCGAVWKRDPVSTTISHNIIDARYQTISLLTFLLLHFLLPRPGKDRMRSFLLVFLYVFLSMFTILNMLIGVLCEVVTAVSQESKEETLIHYVQCTLLTVIEEIDESGNGMVSREEFVKLIKDPRAIKAFEDLNVDIDNFEKMTGMLFDPDTPGGPDKEMHPGMFLKRVLEMRGNNHARVFDIIELSNQLLRVESKLAEKLEKRVEALQGELARKT